MLLIERERERERERWGNGGRPLKGIGGEKLSDGWTTRCVGVVVVPDPWKQCVVWGWMVGMLVGGVDSWTH